MDNEFAVKRIVELLSENPISKTPDSLFTMIHNAFDFIAKNYSGGMEKIRRAFLAIGIEPDIIMKHGGMKHPFLVLRRWKKNDISSIKFELIVCFTSDKDKVDFIGNCYVVMDQLTFGFRSFINSNEWGESENQSLYGNIFDGQEVEVEQPLLLEFSMPKDIISDLMSIGRNLDNAQNNLVVAARILEKMGFSVHLRWKGLLTPFLIVSPLKEGKMRSSGKIFIVCLAHEAESFYFVLNTYCVANYFAFGLGKKSDYSEYNIEDENRFGASDDTEQYLHYPSQFYSRHESVLIDTSYDVINEHLGASAEMRMLGHHQKKLSSKKQLSNADIINMAMREARAKILKKEFLHGRHYDKLSKSEKKHVRAEMESYSNIIKRLANNILPKLRKKYE